MPVRVQTADFDLTAEVAGLRAAQGARAAQIGAVACFVGTVRDVNVDRGVAAAVSAMTLEHYPGMTERSLEAIVAEARGRWDIFDALVVHRVGALLPQDQIVLVVTVGAHRGEAFAACEFIMDYLKTRAPFWKKERTPDGERWVDARASDDDAAGKWAAGDAARPGT
ncbi:MAG: molybdenum cofactor biosynthesis protein MoaE [Burkholderiales bacterium]|nr:molybdenum cofactor biosynthesis protein MoaE [Burkholderiales bacterium]